MPPEICDSRPSLPPESDSKGERGMRSWSPYPEEPIEHKPPDGQPKVGNSADGEGQDRKWSPTPADE